VRLEYSLNLQQSQKLIITPELRQAITILQLPALELTMYIDQQLQENPMLELQENEAEEEESIVEGKQEDEHKYDLDWEDYFQDSSDLGFNRLEKRKEQPAFSYESFLTRAPTLTEHLMFQLKLSTGCGQERVIGEYLIGNMDENGYLQVSLQEVADRLKVDISEAARLLTVIQGFDPPGIGARNLKECLLIQVGHLGINNKILPVLIEECLDDLARGKLNKIARDLNMPVREVQQAADILKTLEPKPGRNFSNANDVRYIVPDIVLEKVEGEYIILVNDVFAPRLTVNKTYRSVLTGENNDDPQTRRFVEGKLNAAVWLIRSIEQRRLTLYKVARCLVDLQRDFLDSGVKYLKPLNLKNVAELVELHESTVSRAVSNKYMQTPQGVIEMKYFFSTGLHNTAGAATSTESIKKLLQEIVAGEDPGNPLNDQKITETLRQKGIKISRRTVAKYRDELGIPAVAKRRRY